MYGTYNLIFVRGRFFRAAFLLEEFPDIFNRYNVIDAILVRSLCASLILRVPKRFCGGHTSNAFAHFQADAIHEVQCVLCFRTIPRVTLWICFSPGEDV